jgi:hypothetical protein
VSKKYKGKVCVYCAKRPSTTGDHVFAREFFLLKHRNGLPQVPACDTCNGEKSELEHYLTAVLPFGGRHPDASVNLETMVPKRLQRNAKLRTRLAEGYTREKIPLESGRIERFFVLIAKGLLWHHWQSILGADDCAAATVLQPAGAAPLDQILSKLRPCDRVRVNLGEGTFIYEGLRTIDSPQSALWRFLIYGGLSFAENSRDPSEKASLIFAVTGPRTLLPNFWKTVFGEKL